MIYTPGTYCTINRVGDLYMLYEAREFIDAHCVIIKRCKSGLIQVALVSDPKRTQSFAQCNVTLVCQH